MAERWTKKLSFPKMGRSRETESVAHQATGSVGGQPIGAGLEVGLAADHGQTRRDPGADAAEILSSCELIPSAMPLPSIQESGPSTADETSEGNRNHIVEVGIVEDTWTAVAAGGGLKHLGQSSKPSM
jgi:hypothetical protein